jgi:hypothetical protein
MYEDDVASAGGLGSGSNGIEGDAFASPDAVAVKEYASPDESVQWDFIDFLGVVVEVERCVDVRSALATHPNRHEVESVLRNRRVLGDVRNGVAGVHHGLGCDFSGKVYDTNYLHEKKLLPVRQEGNSMASHCFANL